MTNPRTIPVLAGWTAATAAGRCCAMTRGELLIAPADALSAGGETALTRRVAQTLDDPHCLNTICGDHLVLLFAGGGFRELGCSPFAGHYSFTEGLWPEPLGLRATISADPLDTAWTVESDRYGVRPVFYGLDPRRRPIVSTRPEVVAALTGATLSAHAVAECLVVGFTLQSHSLFEGVRRLRPGERLVHTTRAGFRVATVAGPEPARTPPAEMRSPEAWISALAPRIVEAFESGAALELSGGVDSRLVLALGKHAGAKPRLAVTLGTERDEDVRVARAVCEHLGLEHRVLPAEIDPLRIAADGLSFARRAGFAVNACSYAWLPAVFDKLAPRRTAQIGGGGGECASGFYYSSLDPLCRARPLQSLWVHRRLFRSGVTLAGTFGPRRGEQLDAEITGEALRLLRFMDGSWRRRTDELYLTQRVPNAGGAVLSASACWYEPLQPLLHEAYIEWGRTLDTEQRAGRRMQMEIIHRLDPQLGAIPYSSRRHRPSGPGGRLAHRLRTAHGTAGRIRRRLRHEPAAARPGAATVARALVRDEWVHHSLLCLAEREEPGLDRARVEQMMSDPDRHEHELGTLISAAWAAEGAETIAREIETRPERAALST